MQASPHGQRFPTLPIPGQEGPHTHFVRETNEPTTNVGGHSGQSKGSGFKTPHQAIKTGKVMWLGAFL